LKGGQKLSIDTKFSGIPKPTAKWFHNDQPLEPTNTISIETNSTFSKLAITDVTAKNSGKYKITAENSEGADSAEFTVKIKG